MNKTYQIVLGRAGPRPVWMPLTAEQKKPPNPGEPQPQAQAASTIGPSPNRRKRSKNQRKSKRLCGCGADKQVSRQVSGLEALPYANPTG